MYGLKGSRCGLFRVWGSGLSASGPADDPCERHAKISSGDLGQIAWCVGIVCIGSILTGAKGLALA